MVAEVAAHPRFFLFFVRIGAAATAEEVRVALGKPACSHGKQRNDNDDKGDCQCAQEMFQKNLNVKRASRALYQTDLLWFKKFQGLQWLGLLDRKSEKIKLNLPLEFLSSFVRPL